MVRKSYKSILVLAVSALALTSCGKEEVTDLSDTWTKAENDLTAMLTEFQAKHGDLTTKFQSMQTSADPTDTTAAANRAAMDQMLKDQATAVGEIQTTINEAKAKREELMKEPKRADFEAAWKDAEAKYAGAAKRLEELKSQQGTIESKLNAAPATTTDTAAATTAAPAGEKSDDVKKDATTKSNGEKKDDKGMKIELNKN